MGNDRNGRSATIYRDFENLQAGVRLLLIDDARRGFADIEAGRTFDAEGSISQLQQRRGTCGMFLTSQDRIGA